MMGLVISCWQWAGVAGECSWDCREGLDGV